MYCKKCGTETGADGTCPKCEAQPLSNPKPCWNPNAVANWSLLFSPIFGAWLTYLNWQALGEAAYAKRSKYWLIGWIALLPLLGILLNIADKYDMTFGIAVVGSAIALFLVWFYVENRKQNRYLIERFGKTYPRRGWLKPLVIAAAIWVIWPFAIDAIRGNKMPSVPQCDNADVQKQAMKLTTQILQTELLHQYVPKSVVATYEEAKNSDNQMLQGYTGEVDKQIAGLGMVMKFIRPSGEDEKIRKSICAASIALNNGNTLNLSYTAQFTTDGGLYVEVQIK